MRSSGANRCRFPPFSRRPVRLSTCPTSNSADTYPLRFTLADPPFAGHTGRDVVVAIVDSGIHDGHPHVGQIAGGTSLIPVGDGVDLVDRLGHGTAVAAAIREKGPGVALVAVKVFDRQLATTTDMLAQGIVWAADHGANIINLSLGTANDARTDVLRAAVQHATSRGSIVVSAHESDGVRWLPGALNTVAGVLVDWSCGRDELLLVGTADDVTRPLFRASGYPRPIPGVPREKNLSGISFAVANVTGFLARGIEARGWTSVSDIQRDLESVRPRTPVSTATIPLPSESTTTPLST